MPNEIDNDISGKTFWLLGDEITIKVSGKESEEAYSAWEISVPPNSGPPPHYHTNLVEGFYVVEGQFIFEHGDNSPINAGPGAFIHVTKGIVHTYKNTGHQKGRLFVIGIPAGFEYFFAEAAMPLEQAKNLTPDYRPDIPKLLEISKKHGIVYVPAIKP